MPDRVFLGWERPLLASAAEWLIDDHRVLSDLRVIVPGRRAGRLLLAHLAERLRGFEPPEILTLGGLWDRLAARGRPQARVAGIVESTLLRGQVLGSAPPEVLEKLIGPTARDPEGRARLEERFGLIRQLEDLEWELAAQGLDLRVAGRILKDLESVDPARLDALLSLSLEFERTLERQGLRSPSRARLDLLDTISPDDVATVMLGVLEVPRLFRKLLEHAGGEITCLVGAPERQAQWLDDWGCPRVRAESMPPLDLGSARVVIADSQRAQLDHLASEVRRWTEASSPSGRTPRYEEAEVAVVVSEPDAAPLVEEALSRAGVEHHSPFLRSVADSPPIVALEMLWRYRTSRRLRDLLRVLRVPIVERWLDAQMAPDELVSEAPRQADPQVRFAVANRDWISVLERIVETAAVDRVRGRLTGDVLALDTLRRLDEHVGELLPLVADRRASLAALAELACGALEQLYSLDEGDRLGPEEDLGVPWRFGSEAERGLSALGTFFEQCRALGEASVVAPRTWMRLLRELVEEGSAPNPSGGVEVLGWLELALDDAPAVAVVGMNEGSIPTRSRGLLPDSARARLGLTDDSKRLARDAFLLEQLVHSRDPVTLLAARTPSDGEPAMPSRLLLMSRGAVLARSVESYLTRAEGTTMRTGRQSRIAPDVWDPAPPAVESDWQAPNRWRVTMFRDYLSCPYRFFLRHCAQLSPGTVDAPELGAPAFGQLAHETLRRFALDVDRPLEERELIAQLDLALESVVALRLAPSVDDLPPILRIQLEQLRRRMRRYAGWQVEEWRKGWVIEREWIERPVQVELDVDSQPVVVAGRIDRVDRHPQLGWRLIDYKTGDRARTPESGHRDGEGWSDLQLPLYERLARANGLEGPASLALVAISKDSTSPILLAADWDEGDLAEATETAREVVRQVRRGVFWPPSPARYVDGLELVSGDTLSPSPAELVPGTGSGSVSSRGAP